MKFAFRALLSLGGSLWVFCAPGFAVADEESGGRPAEKPLERRSSATAGHVELQRELDELLVTIRDLVKDVQSHRGTSYLSAALDLTTDVESQLQRLERASDGAEAKRIVFRQLNWVRELRLALKALREMKAVQDQADEGAGECAALENTLQDRIHAYVEAPTQEERALQALLSEANQTGAQVRARMDAAAETERLLSAWRATARSFSPSEGAWGRISAHTRDSADQIHAHWQEKHAALSKACERLTRGQEHPDVQMARAGISRDSTDQDYRSLGDEFSRWKAELDALRDGTDHPCNTFWLKQLRAACVRQHLRGLSLAASTTLPSTMGARVPEAPAATALVAAPSPARAVHFILRLGFDAGGDSLATVQFTDGSTEGLTAGGGVTVAGGLLYVPTSIPIAIESTIGVKVDTAGASNGEVQFERLVLDVLASVQEQGHRLGGGLTFHLATTFSCTGAIRCPDVTSKNAVGGIMQYAYGGYSSGFVWEVGARLTFIEYEFPGGSINGSSLGVLTSIGY